MSGYVNHPPPLFIFGHGRLWHARKTLPCHSGRNQTFASNSNPHLLVMWPQALTENPGGVQDISPGSSATCLAGAPRRRPCLAEAWRRRKRDHPGDQSPYSSTDCRRPRANHKCEPSEPIKNPQSKIANFSMFKAHSKPFKAITTYSSTPPGGISMTHYSS
jgi:hypothetical protein